MNKEVMMADGTGAIGKAAQTAAKSSGFWEALKKGAPVVGKAVAGAGQVAAGKTLTGVGIGAGAARAAGQGAATWLGALGVGSAWTSMQDPGMWFFALGLVKFFAAPFIPPTWNVVLAFAFLILAVVLLFRGKGLLALILFFVWFTAFQSTFSINFALTALILIAAWSIFFGWRSLSEERMAIVPLLVFYLDIGLVALLVQEFNLPLTNLMQNLLLFTPWWAMLGLSYTKRDTLFIQGLKVAGLLYIISLFVIGLVPNVGWEQALPGVGDITEAQESILSRIPRGENPFVSQVNCILAGRATDLQQCIEERQVRSRCEGFKKEGIRDQDNEEYQTCITEVTGKEAAKVTGGIDPTIEDFTKATFEKSPAFANTITLFSESQDVVVPASLVIENPRRLGIDVGLSCQFKKGTELIPGVPSLDFFSTISEETKQEVFCRPSKALSKGSYEVEMSATLSGLKTTSTLRRGFIGEKSEEDRSTIIREFFSGRTTSVSLSPPEFVTVNFLVGGDSTLLDNTQTSLSLVASLENRGTGTVPEVSSVEIELVDGVSPRLGEFCSFDGERVLKPKNKILLNGREAPVGVCFIDVGESLLNPDEFFKNVEFKATVEYSYNVKQSFPVTIEVLTPTQIP